MKRLYIAFALLGIAASASAQNMYDAMLFSENNYYGTARSIAIGNAVTAVGGDLGSIGINPAGSAVAGYSQFTITPGVVLSTVNSNYYQPGVGADNSDVTSKSRFGLPNIGFVQTCYTGRDYGVKSYSFGLVSNRTMNYNSRFNSFGRNSHTSRFAEIASACSGYTAADLGAGGSNAYWDSSAPWDCIAAYRGNLISGYDNDHLYYAGNTEFVADGGLPYVPGELNQAIDVRNTGSKQDIVFNLGLNINDKIYVGANIGIPTADYQYNEFFSESAVNPEMFPITFIDSQGAEVPTNFKNGVMEYQRNNDIDGIYAKVGAIFLPTRNLRIGASIQTPTAYTIKEMWQYTTASTYAASQFNRDEFSELGEYTYCLRSPYIADFGVAYTFGGRGFLSVDYELTDYSVMRFSELHDDAAGYDYFYEVNESNRLFGGIQHQLRAGLEFRVTPEFALRAGYNLITTPERYYTSSNGDMITANDFVANFEDLRGDLHNAKYFKDKTQAFSFGAGYSSPGSFFMDVAARFTGYPMATFSPYYDYENYNAAGETVNFASPRVDNWRKVMDIVMTIGFRF